VLLHVVTANIPRVPPHRRLKLTDLGDNFYTIVAEYGFMQHPNVPHVLHRCAAQDLKFNMMETSFFVGRAGKGFSSRPLPLPDLRAHAPQCARRDGFLPRPAEPGHRARQPDGDLKRHRNRREKSSGTASREIWAHDGSQRQGRA
jgi:hypothetical protein